MALSILATVGESAPLHLTGGENVSGDDLLSGSFDDRNDDDVDPLTNGITPL